MIRRAVPRQLKDQPVLNVLQQSGGGRDDSVEACLALSYNSLDGELRRRFRALGVFAEAPFDVDAMAALWGDEAEDSVAAAETSGVAMW